MKPIERTLTAAALLAFTAILGVLIFGGCSSTAPRSWEMSLYDVATNTTPVVLYQTNTVTRTNVIESVVTRTNVVDGVVNITMTPTREYTVIGATEVTFKTNYLVDYAFTTKTNTSDSLQTASGLVGLFNPAAGGLVSLLGGGLLGLYAKLRSARKVSAGLAQGIEVAREVMWQMPNGAEYDAKYKEWLREHQRELNIVTGVNSILEKSVNVPAAQKVAEGIKAVLAVTTNT